MSKERKSGSNRVTTLKNQHCDFCGNDKMHENKIGRRWCTVCKRDKE